MATKNQESKDDVIHISVSAKEKAEYQKKARNCGTTLTNYILATLEHTTPVFLKVEGSKKLAESIYDFRDFLNKNAANYNLLACALLEKTYRKIKEKNEFKEFFQNCQD